MVLNNTHSFSASSGDSAIRSPLWPLILQVQFFPLAAVVERVALGTQNSLVGLELEKNIFFRVGRFKEKKGCV